MAGNEDLTGFIREALNRGVSRDAIRDALRRAEWTDEEIPGAMRSFAPVEFPIAVPRPRPSLSAREAFEYLVLFGTLYLSAIALGTLLFQFIDLAFPDPLWTPQRFQMANHAIRQSIASLVVGTPIFLYMTRRITLAVAHSPLKRASPVRRWLTYLTLAIAVGVLIGDSTTLVYNLLGGDVTPRFLLKALTIGGIAGTAFTYYLSDLRRDERDAGAGGAPEASEGDEPGAAP